MKKTALMIFFLAFTARLFYLNDIKNEILFYEPIVDSGAFDRISAANASGEKVFEIGELPHRLPFYQLFLSSIYKATGHNIYIACIVQSFAGSLVCVILFFLGALIFAPSCGIIAGIMGALYWPFIAFEAKTLPINLALLFSVLALLMLVLYDKIRRKDLLFISGFCIAGAALAQANLVLLFPAVLFYILAGRNNIEKVSERFKAALIFGLGFLVVLVPLIAKDFSKRKEVMPIQDNFAVVAYIGASIDHVWIKPGSTYKRIMREILDKGLLTIRETNKFWIDRTVTYIKQDVSRYISNLGQKIYLFFNHYEFSPRENINYFREHSGVLSLPLLHMGIIAPLGLVGFALAIRQKSALALNIFFLTSFLSLLLFPPFARFRIVLVPLLMLFAGFCVSRFYEMFLARSKKSVITALVLLVTLYVLTNTNPFRPKIDEFSRPYYHVGLAYKKSGDLKKAMYYEKLALMKHPHDADILETIGNIYLANGDNARAMAAFRAALRAEPKFPEVEEKIGVLLAQSGDMAGAERIFLKVLTGYPTEYPSTHINLGNCYLFQKKYKEAGAEFERAIALSPDNLLAYYRLLALYEETKDPRTLDTRERITWMGGKP